MTAPTCKRHPDEEMVVVEEGTLNGVEVRYYGCPAVDVDQRDCQPPYVAHLAWARWWPNPCGCVTRHCETLERVDEPVGEQADLFGGDV